MRAKILIALHRRTFDPSFAPIPSNYNSLEAKSFGSPKSLSGDPLFCQRLPLGGSYQCVETIIPRRRIAYHTALVTVNNKIGKKSEVAPHLLKLTFLFLSLIAS